MDGHDLHAHDRVRGGHLRAHGCEDGDDHAPHVHGRAGRVHEDGDDRVRRGHDHAHGGDRGRARRACVLQNVSFASPFWKYVTPQGVFLFDKPIQ